MIENTYSNEALQLIIDQEEGKEGYFKIRKKDCWCPMADKIGKQNVKCTIISNVQETVNKVDGENTLFMEWTIGKSVGKLCTYKCSSSNHLLLEKTTELDHMLQV